MDMQEQQEPNWCWAAVAASIHDFLDGGPATKQGKIATPVLVLEKQIPDGVDCAATPELCNYTAALDDALTVTGNLKPGGFKQGRFHFFDNVKNWINAGLPVGVRIVWAGGGAHFVVIDGFREFASGAKQVHVEDPLYGPSFQAYEDFLSDYPPGGNWQDTYLVKRNGGG